MEAGPRDDNGRAGGASADRLERTSSAETGTEAVGSAAGAEERIGIPAPTDGGDRAEAFEEPGESYGELRPQRRLRVIQLAPILLLSLLGSLMFAFPLAFAFDKAGAVVAMLGLLIGCSAAGWGMIAARRVGYAWPGLPPPGSGRRPDWRILALYGAGLLALAALAVWRVASLR